MTPADQDHGPLPRYGIRDDEKTRPHIVLFDWDADDEATVHASPIEQNPVTSSPPARTYEFSLEDIEELDDIQELDEFDVKSFRPRWHGIGRRPGAVALAMVLGVSFAIGVLALLGSDERHAGAADASALLAQ